MPATVLVGCYERFLFGFEADVEAEVRWKRARALLSNLEEMGREKRTLRKTERGKRRREHRALIRDSTA